MAPRPRSHHAGHCSERQPQNSPHEHVEHALLVGDVIGEEPTAQAEAGVVDEQVDGAAIVAQPILDQGCSVRRGQVGRQRFSIDTVLGAQFGGELLQPFDVARDQHHVVTRRRELADEGQPDPRRRAGDDRSPHAADPTGRIRLG